MSDKKTFVVESRTTISAVANAHKYLASMGIQTGNRSELIHACIQVVANNIPITERMTEAPSMEYLQRRGMYGKNKLHNKALQAFEVSVREESSGLSDIEDIARRVLEQREGVRTGDSVGGKPVPNVSNLKLIKDEDVQ